MIVGAGARYQYPGEIGGEREVTLTIPQMPTHGHRVQYGGADTAVNDSNMDPGSNWGVRGTIGPAITSEAGGNQPHPNMPPYIALYFCKKD